jgi:hypothetical protein
MQINQKIKMQLVVTGLQFKKMQQNQSIIKLKAVQLEEH